MKKGFTLIELLVVITIIGILATGATTVYTSQIQKARDTTRTSDIKALQGGVEQYYQDSGTYPGLGSAFRTAVVTYTPRLPQDPKIGVAGVSAFDYLYNASADANNIPFQEYELSTTFEQSGNITGKAANTSDNGDDNNRYETGIDVNDATLKRTVRTAAVTGYSATNRCVGATGGASSTCNGTNATVIRTN